MKFVERTHNAEVLSVRMHFSCPKLLSGMFMQFGTRDLHKK